MKNRITDYLKINANRHMKRKLAKNAGKPSFKSKPQNPKDIPGVMLISQMKSKLDLIRKVVSENAIFANYSDKITQTARETLETLKLSQGQIEILLSYMERLYEETGSQVVGYWQLLASENFKELMPVFVIAVETGLCQRIQIICRCDIDEIASNKHYKKSIEALKLAVRTNSSGIKEAE